MKVDPKKLAKMVVYANVFHDCVEMAIEESKSVDQAVIEVCDGPFLAHLLPPDIFTEEEEKAYYQFANELYAYTTDASFDPEVKSPPVALRRRVVNDLKIEKDGEFDALGGRIS